MRLGDYRYPMKWTGATGLMDHIGKRLTIRLHDVDDQDFAAEVEHVVILAGGVRQGETGDALAGERAGGSGGCQKSEREDEFLH